MLHPNGPLQVDLFNVSPPRSANRWLAWCLDAHPSASVARPPTPGLHKTPEILRNRSDLAFYGLLAEYQERYSHARPGNLLADFTTYQLTDAPNAIPRILDHNPDARITVVLRDPVVRLYDHYCAALRTNDPLIVPPSFEAALEIPSFLDTSRYHSHLTPWMEAFDANRVHVILDSDLQVDPLHVLERLYAFGGVNRRFVPSGAYLRRDTFPDPPAEGRTRWTDRVRKAPEAARALLRRQRDSPDIPPLHEKTADRLAERLAPEIDALETLIGRDLDHWRAPRDAPLPPEATTDLTARI